MLKRIALIALIALAAVSIASAKTYTFTISDRVQAGDTQLKPGDYHLKVDGSDVVLLDHGGRRIDVNMKLEEADGKFSATSLTISTAEATPRLESVELGGSKVRIVFQ